MMKFNPNSKGVRIALTALIAFCVFGVLLYAIFGVVYFIYLAGRLFSETTGGSPLYLYGSFLFIGLFVGRGALFEIILGAFQKVKNKLLKKEEL